MPSAFIVPDGEVSTAESMPDGRMTRSNLRQMLVSLRAEIDERALIEKNRGRREKLRESLIDELRSSEKAVFVPEGDGSDRYRRASSDELRSSFDSMFADGDVDLPAGEEPDISISALPFTALE